jgi:hypothetical protein
MFTAVAGDPASQLIVDDTTDERALSSPVVVIAVTAK